MSDRPSIGTVLREPVVARSVMSEQEPQRVGPKERFIRGVLALPVDAMTEPLIHAARRAILTDHFTTIGGHPRFLLFHLQYPGVIDVPALFTAPRSKWIYAAHVRRREFLAEIHAGESTNEWRCRYMPRPEEQDAAPALDVVIEPHELLSFIPPEVELPSRDGDSPADFGFFLSPVRLSAAAMRRLIATIGDAAAPDPDHGVFVPGLTVADSMVCGLSDPLEWAVEAHDRYYLPLLNEYREWVDDPERQAEIFIASTLKQWIDSGDPHSIAGKLKGGQPGGYIAGYREKEQELRVRAEEAAAYLAHCVDALEHRIVEQACMDRKFGDTALAAQAWAVCTERILESAPGQRLALRLARDEQRLPGRIFFGDYPADGGVALAHYEWQAGLKIIEHLYAAVIEHVSSKSGEQLVAFSKGVMEKYIRDGVEESEYIDRRLKKRPKMKPKTAAKKYRRIQLRKDLRLTERREANPLPHFKTRGDAWTLRAGVTATHVVSFTFEVINFTNAWKQYADSSPADRWGARVTLIGASADMLAMCFELSSHFRLVRSALPAHAGTVAGIVSGISEAHDRAVAAAGAHIEGNYGAQIGHGIAFAGATAVAVGSGLQLGVVLAGVLQSAAIAEMAFPPAAPVIIVGAALVAVGATLAVVLETTDVEKFALRSFLGRDHDSDPIYPAWAFSALPDGSRTREQINLLGLISNFRIRLISRGDPRVELNGRPIGGIEILPGYLLRETIMHVHIELRSSRERFTAELDFYPDSEAFVYQGGNMMPRLDAIEFETAERRPDGNVTRIYIPARPVSLGGVRFEDHHAQPGSCTVRVRLEAGRLSVPMPIGKWVRLASNDSDHEVHSLDTSRWIMP
jgi:hypothetical protein